MVKTKAEFPEKLQCLFDPHRYKVLYGGRGGAKSWGIARALLIQGASKPLRILCGRELQSSIRDSVHQLLSDQIENLGLSYFYEIEKTAIKGKNGTHFGFEGLRHNVTQIKSWEGADICWVEEAQTVSKASWSTLIPTIRKDNSEIWISFNPDLETDETNKRFVLNPPPGAVVVKIGYDDNPWFPEVLEQEREYLKETDPDAYMNVWEGFCRQFLDGAIYAKELRLAQEQGRITKVPYDQSKPVNTYWDLGHADCTSIWFTQDIGFEHRIIDFYQNSQEPLNHYLGVLQNRGYIYGRDYLPHDGNHKQLATGKSIEELMRAAGRKVEIVPKLTIDAGINAVRTIMPNCWFDEAKCADGLQSLRHYRYDVNPETKQFSKNPKHDINSHASDAFRYFGVGHKQIRMPVERPHVQQPSAWMGM